MTEYLKKFLCHVFLGSLVIFCTGGLIVYSIALVWFLREHFFEHGHLFLGGILLCWLLGWGLCKFSESK